VESALRSGGFSEAARWSRETATGLLSSSSSDAGMLDIHDRRPLVLSPEYAAPWIDPALPPREAEELVLEHGLCVEEFGWHPVGKEAGTYEMTGLSLSVESLIRCYE